MIKLNPVITLPDDAKNGVYLFYVKKNVFGRMQTVMAEYKYSRVSFALGHTQRPKDLYVHDSHDWCGEAIPLKNIFGWISKKDLLLQLVPAHKVKVEGAVVKDMEVTYD